MRELDKRKFNLAFVSIDDYFQVLALFSDADMLATSDRNFSGYCHSSILTLT